MSVDQESHGFAEPKSRISGLALASMHPLKQASLRIADHREGRTTLKARDLVGLLLSHGARAWRASQPVARARIKVSSASGHPAVRIRFR
ncbi:hypothetical protein ASG43_07695 [Aureimonas sp. Leaf454]|uniref:hypothetical protein n=1 Tax=Aureimonas sp. Leaf454 TaxID=1736381 RepID=UPI0006FAED83|nr:hypothetical protein [Aureimonas sp. Leaf454]KQT48735.1 hypothetical protein ASG43_07695 [Aureimonas sp. Leaf454]